MVPEPRSAYAVRFFLLAGSLLAVAAFLALTLLKLVPADRSPQPNRFSLAFVLSTCLLLSGSACMSKALQAVKRERQTRFRNWLKLTLATGTLFVIIQTFALTSLIRRQPPEDVETGAAAFVAVFVFLHGVHFVIAFLFLSYIAVQAFADRYDHEYYWGVTFCSWFWHALGTVWMAILVVMFIARFYE